MFRELREMNEIWAEAGLRQVGRWEYVWRILVLSQIVQWAHRLRCWWSGHTYKYSHLEERPYGLDIDIVWLACQRCGRADPRPRARA